jgi:glycosyltransferase involved in cell wall biosynthesis
MTKQHTSRLSVLVVGNFLSNVVGNCQHCEELASHLQMAGHHVIITSSRKGRISRLLDMLYTCWERRQHYQVAQVSVFSGPSFFWAEAVCWMLRQLGKPYILSLHGGDLPSFARKWPTRVRRLLESAALVCAPSRYLQRELLAIHPAIVEIPNAIELDRYKYHPRRTARPKLVWLRAFHSIYNPCLAVRVAAELRSVYPDVELVMAGPDKGDGSLLEVRKLAAQLGIAEALRLPGAIPKTEISSTLHSSDIFLNTTNADNTPVSVLEAMACGACIVSTNVGGIPYLLEHEKDALLVPRDDPQAMARAVQRIIESRSLCAHLSEAARRKVENMDWPEVLAAWEELFAHVLAPAPSPRAYLESQSPV